jgi:hypothetical protein
MYWPIRQRTHESSLGTFVESCTTSTQLHSVTGVLLALEMMWINRGQQYRQTVKILVKPSVYRTRCASTDRQLSLISLTRIDTNGARSRATSIDRKCVSFHGGKRGLSYP